MQLILLLLPFAAYSLVGRRGAQEVHQNDLVAKRHNASAGGWRGVDGPVYVPVSQYANEAACTEKADIKTDFHWPAMRKGCDSCENSGREHSHLDVRRYTPNRESESPNYFKSPSSSSPAPTPRTVDLAREGPQQSLFGLFVFGVVLLMS